MALLGTEVTRSAGVDAAGGDAQANLAGSTGGRGGRVSLEASFFGGVANTGAVQISGGTGETPGDAGWHEEDGLCVAGTRGAP